MLCSVLRLFFYKTIMFQILRNKGNACARKLETDLQITSETALSHLVQGSNAVAEMMQHIKSFMIEREKIKISTHQSAVGTPTTEKVQRVPPLMLGGRFIQPVVSLSRTMLPHNICKLFLYEIYVTQTVTKSNL